jgi:hypothetical protein
VACANHPEVAEAWACSSCERRLCSQCVVPVGVTRHFTCNACGHEARHAAPVLRGRGAIEDAVKRIASLEGVVTAAAIAVFYGLAYFFQPIAIVYLSALVGYYFTIVHHVGAGHEGFPGPSEIVEDDLFAKAVRGFVCVVFAIAPWLAWIAVKRVLPPLETAIPLLLLGQLYMPALLLSVAFSNSLLGIWPVAWIRVIGRAPAAYARFLGLWMVTVIVGVGIGLLTDPLLDSGLGMYLAAVVWALYWFVQAGLIGQFLRANAAVYGWD